MCHIFCASVHTRVITENKSQGISRNPGLTTYRIHVAKNKEATFVHRRSSVSDNVLRHICSTVKDCCRIVQNLQSGERGSIENKERT